MSRAIAPPPPPAKVSTRLEATRYLVTEVMSKQDTTSWQIPFNITLVVLDYSTFGHGTARIGSLTGVWEKHTAHVY